MSGVINDWPSQSNTSLNTTCTSADQTVGGSFSAPAAVSVGPGSPSSAEYSINGGAWRSSGGTVTPGDRIRVRHTASSQFSTTTTTQILVADFSPPSAGNFSTTTQAMDTNPDAISFTDVTGAVAGSSVISNAVAVSGINTTVSASVAGASSDASTQFRVNGGAWISIGGSASVRNGDLLEVKVTASSAYNGTVSAELNVGSGSSALWTVTTAAGDVTADPFTFTDVSGATPSTLYTSNTVTLAGMSAGVPTNATVSSSGNGSGYQYQKNGGAWIALPATISVQQGDQIAFRMTSPATAGQAGNITFNVGGTQDTWSVTTTTADTTPDPFDFTDSTAGTSQVVESNQVTVHGIDAATSLSFATSGNGSAYQYRKYTGGAWTAWAALANDTISNGELLQIRMTAPATIGQTGSITPTIGGVSDSWTITAVALDTAPDPFAFDPVAGAEPNVVQTSNTVTPSGFNGPSPISVSSGGTYSINGGAFTSLSGTINPGDNVCVQVRAPAAFASAFSATLSIGGVSAAFSVTTRSPQLSSQYVVHFRESIYGATSTDFLNGWHFSGSVLEGFDVGPQGVTQGLYTYGPRTILYDSTTVSCLAGAHGAAYMVAPNTDANRDNAELLSSMTTGGLPSPASFYPGLVLRGSGASGAENGYVCWVTNTALHVAKLVAGTLTELGNLAYDSSVTLDRYIRFRVNGTTVCAKIWDYDQAEPIDWQLTFTDASVAGVGFMGFYAQAVQANGINVATPGFISAGTNGETAPRPLSAAEQSAWLNDDSNPRIVLAEAGVLGQDSGGGALDSKVLISTWPFVTEAGDNPPNQVYDDIIVQAPTITSKASEQLVGRSTMSIGDCIINNEDGVRDHWLFWNWDGRSYDMWVGGIGWRRWDFIKVGSFVTSEVYVPRKDQLGLKIRDKSALLNRKVQTQVLGGTGTNSGDPKPIVWGRVFNIEPQLIDAATFRYKFHDESLAGAVGIVGVRNNGLAVSFTDQGNGEFTLNADPAGGHITMDVNVDVSAGSAVRAGATYPHLLQTLAEDRAGLGANTAYVGNRTGSLATFVGFSPPLIGLRAKGDENIMDLMDQAAISAGGFWYFNELGLLCAARVRVPGPSESYDHTLIEDDVEDFKVEKLFLPSEAQQLGYQKNWTVQTDGFAGAVSAANRVLYASPAQYTVVTPSYSGLDQPANHLLRERPVAVDTLFYNKADAEAEVTRRDTIYRKTTALVSFTSKFDFLSYNQGESLLLTYPRYGFDNGKPGIIMGLEKTFTSGTRITLLVQLDAVFPVTEVGTPFVQATDFY